MKIAFLSVFQPFRGGIAQFNEQLFHALSEENEIKAFNFTTQYPNFLFPGKTQFVEDTNDVKFDSTRVLSSVNPFSYIQTVKEIKKYQPDLLIVGYWMPFMAPSLGYVAGKLSKQTKVISIVHNAIPHEKKIIDKPFTRYFLNRSTGFVTLSNAVKKDIQHLNKKANILEVKHPIYSQYINKKTEFESRKELNLNTKDKVVLFFGLIRDYKGLDLLIESFSHLDNSYKLLIAGEVYGDQTVYTSKIKALNLEGKVVFHNKFIPDDVVQTYFNASDVCVLPYKTATQSGITAIANHFNIPQIVTDVGGLKETITEGKTGLVVSERTPENMAKTICFYFDNELKLEMSKNIAKEKQENTWPKMAKKIIDFAKMM